MSFCQAFLAADAPLTFSVLSPDHHGPFMSKADVSRDTGLSIFNPLGTQSKCAWRKKSASTAVSGCAGDKSFSGQGSRQKHKLSVHLSYLRSCLSSFSLFLSLAESFSFYSCSFLMEVSCAWAETEIKSIENFLSYEPGIKYTAKQQGKKYTVPSSV